jgi:hypothetical protein
MTVVSRTSRVAVACLAVLAAGVTAVPAAAVPATTQRPQLEISAEFGKPVYRTGEQISVTFRVRNVGTEPAVGLHASNNLFLATELRFDPRHWGELNFAFGQPGLTLEPGAAYETTLSGFQGKPDADTVTLTGNVFDQSGFGAAQFAFTAPVTLTTSHVAGTIFGDRNGNGAFDAGEEAPGATLTLHYTFAFEFSPATTADAAGRFDFGELPAVAYSTDGTAAGFNFPFVRLDIDATRDNSDLRIRAVPPLNGALHAAMAFTKNRYRPGDTAHIKVTLTNSGPIPLTGLVASCNRSGEGPQLSGTGPGWGALAADAAGVTVQPGQTRRFDVSEQVPASAFDFGYVLVACDVNYSGVLDETAPEVSDTARVPGALTAVSGRIIEPVTGPNQPLAGIPGVLVTLVRDNHVHAHVIGRATTDAGGNFAFPDVVPGTGYTLRFRMPPEWTLADQPFSVVANRGEMVFVAQPSQAG